MVATVTSVPVASAGPLMLPGNPRALPWSTVFPVLQRNDFKPSSLSSNLLSFPHQTLHSLRIIWPPNSQKRTKSNWNIPNHHHPPSCSPPPPNPQIYPHPCPAFPTAAVEKGPSTCMLVSSPSCHLGHLDVLTTSLSSLSLSPPSVVRLLYLHSSKPVI